MIYPSTKIDETITQMIQESYEVFSSGLAVTELYL
jgi:hypothetical protein